MSRGDIPPLKNINREQSPRGDSSPGHAHTAHERTNDISARSERVLRPISEIEEKEDETLMNKTARIVFVVLAVLGIATGFFLSKQISSGGLSIGTSSNEKPTLIKTDKVAGISDSKTFKDSATGVIEKGGLSGEGTHKLVRDGGPSQTVYMVSSVVDLDEYIGKKVTVWGETMAAKKVSWLMDVGKVELQ